MSASALQMRMYFESAAPITKNRRVCTAEVFPSSVPSRVLDLALHVSQIVAVVTGIAVINGIRMALVERVF
jgi:hypothetical protein